MKYLIGLLLIIGLVACGPAKLDTTTNETAEASMKQIMEGASTEQKAQLQGAFVHAAGKAVFSGKGTQPSVMVAQFNGMNAEQIIAAYQAEVAKMAAEQAAKLAEQVRTVEVKLAELRAQQSARIQALESLTKVKVENLSLQKTPDRFMSRRYLEANLSNALDETLTGIKINFRIITSGRDVPWNEDKATFLIDGGLQKNESRKDVAYGSDMYGFILAAKAMKEHPEAVLEWAVVDVYGVNKNSILPVDVSNDIKQLEKNLSELKKQ